MTPFKFALDHVLKVEGGFSDHPADKGGPTNFGITLATLSAWRKAPCKPADIKNLTLKEATQIYEKNYWSAMNLSLVKTTNFACMLFDQGVNRGTKTTIEKLQQLLNAEFKTDLLIDGKLGAKTAAAINGVSNKKLSLAFIRDCQMFYVNLAERNPSQRVFLKGWLARTWRLFDLLA